MKDSLVWMQTAWETYRERLAAGPWCCEMPCGCRKYHPYL
jgi:hypothetical protein